MDYYLSVVIFMEEVFDLGFPSSRGLALFLASRIYDETHLTCAVEAAIIHS
jgi:hypothetical protein